MSDGVVEEVSKDRPYVMSIGLNVLHHLGINLYSNAAAVLSEAVANAWDADAQTVSITIEEEKIVITDDGCGMGVSQINSRFLTVGYDKRKNEGDQSLKKRYYMGRKGIGKLSLFSIADVVEIHTFNGVEKHGFLMRVDDIIKAIDANEDYHPEKIDPNIDHQGTRIELTTLKKKRAGRTAAALRKRIARRFSVLGLDRGGDKFDVKINGENISRSDREDLQKVEFLWTFDGTPEIAAADVPMAKKRGNVSAIVGGNPNWKVTGWLGTVDEPKELSTDDTGAMNNVIVLSRGRLIQENILDKVNFSRLLSNYLTGQIEADFLDLSSEDDIATSDRQRLIEDDERYRALVIFLRHTLVSIADKWTAWRNEARGKDAIAENVGLGSWIDTLPKMQRNAAQKMLGLIRGVQLESEEQRRELYKSGMLAFERLRLRSESHLLGDIDNMSVEKILPLLSDLASLEGSLYREIVKSRIDVIRKFENLVDINVKEKVLQEHLFNNLWLLDPGWDHATENSRIEGRLKKDYPEFSDTLSEKESKGRYDIRYRNTGGMHIIVELKRADREMTVTELLEQGQKYVGALHKCLAETGEKNPPISIVFVLGKRVTEESHPAFGRVYVENQLKPLNARIVYFEELIQNALLGYSDYLERSKEYDKIEGIMAKMDAAALSAAASEKSKDAGEETDSKKPLLPSDGGSGDEKHE
jgi:hypothetical protein